MERFALLQVILKQYYMVCLARNMFNVNNLTNSLNGFWAHSCLWNANASTTVSSILWHVEKFLLVFTIFSCWWNYSYHDTLKMFGNTINLIIHTFLFKLFIKRIFRNLICWILKLLLLNSNMVWNNKSLLAAHFSNQWGKD